jgi:hypothetical protein
VFWVSLFVKLFQGSPAVALRGGGYSEVRVIAVFSDKVNKYF